MKKLLFLAGLVLWASQALGQGGVASSSNARKIQGVDVCTTAPTNTQGLVYDSGTSKWCPAGVVGTTSTIVADETTNATMYCVWTTATSGNLALKISSTCTWNPSTDTLTATIVNATTGIKINGAATSGYHLVGDGTNFIPTEPGIATSAQTGADYAIAAGTKGYLVTRTNASMADTIAQAGTGSLDALWANYIANIHASVSETITPTTSTINGVAAWTQLAGGWGILVSDGANYRFLPAPSMTSDGLVAASEIPTVTVTLTTSTPITVSTTLSSAYYYNQHATAGTAITYNLPTAAAGKQFCFKNSYNGSAANTGAVTVATSAAGQYLIDTDGTLGSTGGNIVSGGAGGDGMCVVGVDATHWQVYVTKGTWTKS